MGGEQQTSCHVMEKTLKSSSLLKSPKKRILFLAFLGFFH